MHSAHYDVTLLSDVIITADAATVGGHSGLDYLPGSLFLGAAAAAAKERGDGFDPDFFLSGRVRFHDGLPLAGDTPTVPIPCCYHTVKSEKWEGKPPLNLLLAPPGKDVQPKQWRQGYMTADGRIVEIQLESRMKTAIDRYKRRSKDAQLFGYESIPAGTRFRTSVEADTPELLDRAKSLLAEGRLRLGRSRSAEYGAVRLTETAATDAPATGPNNYVALHLLSDLALSVNGMPVLLPSAEQFGLHDGKLDKAITFIRVRRYSPWNAFHNCRLAERQVIAKGSVIVFQTNSPADLQALRERISRGVGLHREEGLGRIAVNPAWLFNPPALKKHAPEARPETPAPATLLAEYLKGKAAERAVSHKAFVMGVEWAKKWSELSRKIAEENGKAPGKSQWGTIRELAIRSDDTPENLLRTLKEFCTKDLRSRIWGCEAWSKYGEKREFLSLHSAIEREIKESMSDNDGKTVCLALFHAAVEVTRILSRKKNGKEAAAR